MSYMPQAGLNPFGGVTVMAAPPPVQTSLVVPLNPDLRRAFEALKGKKPDLDKWFAYYDGDSRMPYLVERLREIFQNLNYNIQENWCRVVVKATADRIALTGFNVVDNQAAQDLLEEAWAECELDLEADEAHRDALITGESYIIVWKDLPQERQPGPVDDTAEPPAEPELEIYYNDPRLCHIFYDGDNPRKKKFACKWFINNDTGRTHLTLYYPDHFEYFVSTVRSENLTSHAQFAPDPELEFAPNPYGEIPVFHLRSELRRAVSTLKDVTPIQDAVNMMLINMLAGAEFNATPQKYVISAIDLPDVLSNAPNGIWNLPAGDGQGQATQVGQFQASDLTNYLNAIDNLVSAMATISGTPKHFFMKQGGDPSGEALMTMESPLVKKVKDFNSRFAATWRQIASFVLKVQGMGDITPASIEPQFESPETVQPLMEAQVITQLVAAGFPIINVLRRRGWSQSEIDQFIKDRKEETELNQGNLVAAQTAMSEAFNAGAEPLPGTGGGVSTPAPAAPRPAPAFASGPGASSNRTSQRPASNNNPPFGRRR